MTITRQDEWEHNDHLEEMLTLLSDAVVGHRDVDGRIIGSEGVGNNCGVRFQNDTFALRDYCWCEGGVHPETIDWDREDSGYDQMPASGGTSTGCPVNFEHFGTGVKAIWYKRLGRDTEFLVPEWYENEPTASLAVMILELCLGSLKADNSRTA